MFKLEVAAAYALPLASSARMVLPDNPVNHVEPENVARVVEEFANVCVPPHVFDVEVPKARDTVFTERVNGYEKVRGFSYVPKSDTCDLVIERLGRVAIPEIEDDAESLLSNNPLNVVV
jgi:hypothetical protein